VEVIIMSDNDKCPYCKTLLEKIPKRKTKCPHCNNEIFVRTTQKIFNSSLLTKDDAIAADNFKKITDFGITEKDYQNKNNELAKNFNREPDSLDIIWGLYNDLISKTKDLQELKMIYYSMALFLDEEGKDFFEILQLSHKMELQHLKQQSFIKKVEISGAGGCSECNKINGKIFNIDEAINTMPIPLKNCTHTINSDKGFCRCMYLPVFDE